MVVGLFWYVVLRERPAANNNASAALSAIAQIATLAPEMFTGKSREAYQAAKDVPEVLAAVPCYCGCMKYNGHKHNLDCFVDDHGDT
ncbi:MAG: hypothetical protein HY646_05165 [Acidobacteria bacterium]|nr:hypothetical protein [Acidobacteriota bacterium]